MDDFERLLERIRNKEHPSYGTLTWDGQSRMITTTVQFEANGVVEPDEVVRQRALRYLEALSEDEREIVEVEVVFRAKKPVRAVLKAQTGQLSAARLRELQEKVIGQ